MTTNIRLCIICGARVANINPKANTCSPECTITKKTGKTLEDQTREASQIPDIIERHCEPMAWGRASSFSMSVKKKFEVK